MSEVPADLRYTPEHEWIRVEGDQAIIGVTDFAQDALTDVVWVELPEVGMSVGVREGCAVGLLLGDLLGVDVGVPVGLLVGVLVGRLVG